jgi:Fe-S-cluster-containing dehydrogenase component
MISYYGYADGSGEYYIAVDSDKCNGCQKCVNKCPQNILCIDLLFIDLEDRPVVVVKESHCNNLKYLCAQQCQPEKNQTFCTMVCPNEAITCHFASSRVNIDVV